MAGAVEGVTNLLSFLGEGVRGATQVPRGYREGGVGGAVQAFINPQGPEFRDRVQRLQTEEAGRLGGIQDLIDSGVYDEALTQGLTARQQLRAVAPVEVADAVVGPLIQEAGQRMLGRVMQTAPEKRSQEYANLSGFLSGSPEGALAAGKGIAQIRQGEGAADLNQANAQQVTERTPEEVNLLSQQAGEAESRASLNRRTPYRGYGNMLANSDIPERREDRALGAQYDAILKDIASGLEKGGSSLSVTPSLQPLLDRANSIRRQLDPNATMLEFGEQEDPSSVQKDPTKPKIMMAVLREAQGQQQPPGVGPNVPPGGVARNDIQPAPQGAEIPGESEQRQPVPTVSPNVAPEEREKARRQAKTIFRDLIESSRKGRVDITHDQLVTQMDEAGVDDPKQQALIIQLLAEEASGEGPPVRGTPRRRIGPTPAPSAAR